MAENIKLVFILVFILFSHRALAQGSVCYNYDTDSTTPRERLTDQVIRCKHQGDKFYLDGAVDFNLIHELSTHAPVPIKTIYLNSRGGKVADAIEAAAFIRERGIHTVVEKGATCRSACTLLFQAGVERWASLNTTFLYHSVRDPFLSLKKQEELKTCWKNPNEPCLKQINKRYDELYQATDQLFSLYIEYGANADLKEIYFGLGEVEEWWRDGNYLRIVDWEVGLEEALQMNIVTQILTEE